MHKVVLIPGDGIGPSIAEIAVRLIEAAGVKIEWQRHEAGLIAIDKYKDPLPAHVLEAIRETHVALKGPLTTPVGSGFRSVNVALRQEFDLYANLRPAITFAGVPSRYQDIDLIVVRENTEEFYAGIEHFIDPSHSAAETIGVVTRAGSERVVRFAYEYARKHNRKKVTTVHKANILKYTGGLFLEVARKVSIEYPEIQSNDKIVSLFQSGYLDQARQSLDISTYVFQRGAGSLLDLLDAERTDRETQIAYRQALAAYLTSLQQINFAVGRQVLP